MINDGIKYHSEEELMKANPWSELNVGEPGSYVDALYSPHSEFVLSQDASFVAQYNEPAYGTQRLNLHLLPQPWLGNPLKAKVIILNDHPFFDENAQSIVGPFIQHWPRIKDGLMENLMMRLHLSGNGLPYLDARTGGNGTITIGDAAILYDGGYWWNVLDIWRYRGTDKRRDDIFLNTAIVNYFPYYCRELARSARNKRLFSQEFTRDLIEYIGTVCRNTVFIVLRGASQWRKLLGMEWKMLEFEKRIFVLPTSTALKQSYDPTSIGRKLCFPVFEFSRT